MNVTDDIKPKFGKAMCYWVNLGWIYLSGSLKGLLCEKKVPANQNKKYTRVNFMLLLHGEERPGWAG